MSCCTFFGHRDSPGEIYPKLLDVMDRLVRRGVDRFLFGNNGHFDSMAMESFCQLQREYPNISGTVILSYMPKEKDQSNIHLPTLFPFELLNVPKRFAIDARNNWMLDQADCVVTYVTVPHCHKKITE